MHPLRLAPASRLARILRPAGATGAVLRVNSSHHQAVRRENLASGYLVAGTSPAAGGELVEAFESADPKEFVLALQSHPERQDSTPPEFERLWSVFVDACRGSATGSRVG
jgi:gamma-glutamyl-gamma-aminobutyrate hydrolase PuuD